MWCSWCKGQLRVAKPKNRAVLERTAELFGWRFAVDLGVWLCPACVQQFLQDKKPQGFNVATRQMEFDEGR